MLSLTVLNNRKNFKGQSASFDMLLIFLSITLFIALLFTIPEGGAKNVLLQRIRNEYTESLLLSVMYCRDDGRSISELILIYFSNSTEVNRTFIEEKITWNIDRYLKKRNIEWLLFITSENKKLGLPEDKERIEGVEISSASMDLILMDRKKARVYLWIKWR